MMIDGRDWQAFDELTPYPDALSRMEARAEAIHAREAPETIWLMEHPALVTTGHAAPPLPAGLDLPLLPQRRGGGLVYHGPGIRMAYAMLRVADHAPDTACFVRGLEKWAIAALAEFNLHTALRPGHLGAWLPPAAPLGDRTGHAPGAVALATAQPPRQICAVSVRVRRGISLQGLALNLDPDLDRLRALRDPTQGEVTSLVALGYPISMSDLDVALMRSFAGAMASVAGSCAIS